MKSNLLIIISLILGIVFGIYFPSFMNNISFIGTIYINLLKFIVIPIVFTSICVTVYNSLKSNAKTIFNTILTFIVMFISSFLLTFLIVYLFSSFFSFSFPISETITPDALSFKDIIINLFPSNIISIFASNSLFSVIIFAFIFSYGASKVNNGKKVIDLIDAIKNIFYQILNLIMYLTPLGIFSLIGVTIANYGAVVISVGLKYILLAYLCSFVVLILVMILPVWIYAKINPITYIKRIVKVWLISLTTCSSVATLPYTIKACKEKFNIKEDVVDRIVPLGCTINMCGGAVSFALLGLFCANAFGIPVTFISFLLMIFLALAINMAAPGIPNGGIAIGASYLAILGIPLSFIGFYGGIYKLLDMSYTTLNVTGDVSACILISKHALKKSK